MECPHCGRPIPAERNNDARWYADKLQQEAASHTRTKEKLKALLKPKREVVYVAGPLRSHAKEIRQARIARAKMAAETLWGLGWTVICPHMNSGDMDVLDDEQILVDGSLELVRRSDSIYLMPGWTTSRGSIGEAHAAREVGCRFILDTLVSREEAYWWMYPIARVSALDQRGGISYWATDPGPHS
jgi:hypothetical protein